MQYRLRLLLFLLTTNTLVFAQQPSDLPESKNTVSFALKGAVKELTEQYYSVTINASATDSVKNDTTYQLTTEEKFQFDTLGRLSSHTASTYNSRGKQKENDKTIYSYTPTGLINTIAYYEKEHLVYTQYLSYNNDNQLAELVMRDKKEQLITTTLYYYKDRQVFNIKIKDEDNIMQNFIRLNYDLNGNLKEREYRGATMQLLNKQKYIRDTLSAHTTRLNLYDYAADNNLRKMTSYEYDEHGNVLQETATDSNKRTTLYRTNTYNNKNELINLIDFSNEVKEENVYQYEYDMHTNWTRQLLIINGKLAGTKTRTITYYTKE